MLFYLWSSVCVFLSLSLQVIPWVPLVLRSARWTQTLTWRIWAEEADRSALLWWVRRVRPAQKTTRWVPERVWTWADWFQRPSQSRPSVQTRRKPAQNRSQISKTGQKTGEQVLFSYTLIPKSQMNNLKNKVLTDRRTHMTSQWPLTPFFLELRSV